MAYLIDYALVAIVLAIALGAVFRYFSGLGKSPKNESISCAGCNSGCHADLPDNQDYGLLRKLK